MRNGITSLVSSARWELDSGSAVNTRPFCYPAPEGLPRVPKASQRAGESGTDRNRKRWRPRSEVGARSTVLPVPPSVDAHLDVPNRKQMSIMPIALFHALFDQANAKFLTGTIPCRYNLEQSGVSVAIMQRDPRRIVSLEAFCDIRHVALCQRNRLY